MKRTAGVTLAILLATAPLAAQTPKTSESVQVTVVEIPVTVTDANGNPVRNLTAANFEITDAGKKRKVDYFEMVDFGAAAKATQSSATVQTPLRRNFLLLFDLANSSVGNLSRAREAALEFVQKQLLPNDLVAVGTMSPDTGFSFGTAFTTDRRLIAEAINTLANPNYFRAADPLRIAAAPQASDSRPGGKAGADVGAEAIENFSQMMRSVERADDEFERTRIRKQVASLSSLARALDRVKGRKQIVLLSEGFDARLVHGRESLSSAESKADADASLHGEVWNVDNDQRFGSSAASNLIGDMGTIFKRSDVVLHAVDIKGLRSNVDAREGAQLRSNEALHLLSKPTGGEVFQNSNNLNQNFATVLKKQEVVYLLGFPAPSNDPGKFHELKVKLIGVPGGRVAHRAGYYEPSDKPSTIENMLSASDALMNDPKVTDITMRALTAAFPAASGNSVPVIIEIDGRELIRAGHGDVLDADLFVYAFNESGAPVDFMFQSMRFDLNKVRAALNEAGVRFYGTLNLPPGAYSIKTLLRTPTGRIGFARSALEVSDFSKPAVLAPVLFGEAGKWMMLKEQNADATEVYPFDLAGEAFIPAVMPRLKNTATQKLALFTYNLPPESLQLTARVLSAAGTVLPAKIAIAGRTPADEKGATKYLLTFDPAGLAPGAYKLEIDVRSAAANSSFSRAVDFSIE